MTGPDLPHGEVASAALRVGRVPFQITDLNSSVDHIIHLGRSANTSRSTGTPVRLSNAYCVALASKDADYLAVLAGEGITLPDGAPIAWYIRHRTGSVRGGYRVRGPSLFVETLDRGRQHGCRHFMLGATEETLDALILQTGNRYPGAQIVGSYAPPFGPLDADFYAEAHKRISSAKPNVIWIGLGTPKQDFAAAELARGLPGAFVAVGAAFDFLAGSVNEAPKWLQAAGLEWLYRLAAEPRRLWRRYLFGNTRFIWEVLRGYRDI